MKSTIKLLLISLFLSLFFLEIYAFDFQANCEEKTFVVTAYYSPKDWQVFYYKENVVAEKMLNWSGTHGASGRGVFNGMLAAPSTYDFWWKIFFPSFWVGEIADRGGAIVHAGERWDNYDRIDIWMGQWEEWLIRALTFWKRTLTWYYCSKTKLQSINANPTVWLNFDYIPVLKNFFDATLFIQELHQWRTDIRVYKLQEYLMKFWYMNKKTWYFGPETKNALCNYQLKRWITSKKYCWDFWALTRSYMKLESKNKLFLPDFTETTTFQDLIDFAQNYNWSQKSISHINDRLEATSKNYQLISYFSQSYKKNEQNPKIKDLQDVLRHYWFFQWELYDKYDAKTIQAVYDFQLASKILDSNDKTNPARWWLGPATRNALNQKRAEFQERKFSN